MLEIRKFEIVDAHILTATAIEPHLSDRYDIEKWAQINLKSGPAYTGLLNGVPVAAAGIWLVSPGVGQAWAIFSERSKDIKKTLFRSVKTMLEILTSQFEITRLTADCCKDFPCGDRFLRHLGFKKVEESENGMTTYERIT